MKLHPIFSKSFAVWWIVMAVAGFLKYYIFGIPTGIAFKGHGIVFATLGAMFSGLIFGSIVYLFYRLFWRKWNNKVYIFLIAFFWLAILLVPNPKSKKMESDFSNNVEFKNYTSLDLDIDKNNYYHSPVNNFRIQIPEQWSLIKGQALGIELNAVSYDGIAMFSVQIANLKGEKINFEDIPGNFFIDILTKTDRVKNVKVFLTEKTTISNQKALHNSLTFSYSHLNEHIEYELDSYVFLYNKKAYHLICKTKAGNSEKYETDFSTILKSFMLENYK